MKSGRIKHRVSIEAPTYEQDSTMGAMTPTWEDVAKVWASIEPLSARDLIAAKAQQSKIVARIVIRYRDDVQPNMRIIHKNTIYVIEGILPDKDSGLEYLTIPVSYGVKEE